MLRRTLLASAGVMALSGVALAAEPLPPPPPPPPPPPMWTGWYAGLNAGGTFSSSNEVDTAAVPGFFNADDFTVNQSVTSAALATTSVPVSSAGFIGGGQVGYNYQFAPSWVAGFEADIQGVAGASGTGSRFLNAVSFDAEEDVNIPFASQVNASQRLDNFGSVRGRLGWLITPTWLIYGTGGFAWGSVNSDVFILQRANASAIGFACGEQDCDPYTSFGNVSTTRTGWTAGGGVEWMFLPNWSLKIEYLYYDLGSVTNDLSLLHRPQEDDGDSWSSQPFARARFNGNIVRAGINYHFNWLPAPVVAKY